MKKRTNMKNVFQEKQETCVFWAKRQDHLLLLNENVEIRSVFIATPNENMIQ